MNIQTNPDEPISKEREDAVAERERAVTELQAELEAKLEKIRALTA